MKVKGIPISYFAFYSEKSFEATVLGFKSDNMYDLWDYDCYKDIFSHMAKPYPFLDAYTINIPESPDFFDLSTEEVSEHDAENNFRPYLDIAENIILFVKNGAEETDFIKKQLRYGISKLKLPVIIVYLDIDRPFGVFGNSCSEAQKELHNLKEFMELIHEVSTFEVPYDKRLLAKAVGDKDMSKDHAQERRHFIFKPTY